MKRPNLETQLLEVLRNDAKDGGDGLSVTSMAKQYYGNGYIKGTAYQLEKTIRERMGKVVELAAMNGITVFAQRVSCNPKTPEIKSRIAKWKIYDSNKLGMNEALADELMYKKKNGDARTRTFMRLLDVAKEQNALAPEKIKELENF
jgi:hypothetical protein